MILKFLQINNYKNLKNTKYNFDAKFTAIIGNNGIGKTNLLDAIYYLCIGKSYFNSIDAQNICFGHTFFSIDGVFDDDTQVFCGYQDKKIIKLNGAPYTRLADHVGKFTVVMVSPTDTELITDGSEIRRKFMDNIISQTNNVYLKNLILYNKLLLQRNVLLRKYAETRHIDPDLLDIISVQMHAPAQYIYTCRRGFFVDFKMIFMQSYAYICGTSGNETVELHYQSALENTVLSDIFAQNTQADRSAGRTTSGVHKDEIIFYIDDKKPLKKYGSQGQQKSYIIALKLAQYHYIKQKTNTQPLLLLDDIFEKLDKIRLNRLMLMVSGVDFGQVFITDTDAQRVQNLFDGIKQPLSVMAMG